MDEVVAMVDYKGIMLIFGNVGVKIKHRNVFALVIESTHKNNKVIKWI